MMDRPWYKRYGADFVHGALGLTLEEKGAYSLCLDLIYDRGGPIPDDARWLAGVCGCSVRKWNSIRARLILAEKIFELDGFIMNSRARKELEKSSKIARKEPENPPKVPPKQAENEPASNESNDLASEKGLYARDNYQKLEARDQKEKKDLSDERSKENPSGDLELTRPEFLDRSGFAAWWKLYPRKVGKRKAEAKYRGIIRQQEATATQLATGLAASVAYWDAAGKETEHIPHPTTWLEGGRWADDYTTRKRASTYDIVKARARNGVDHGDSGTGALDGPGEADQPGPPTLPAR